MIKIKSHSLLINEPKNILVIRSGAIGDIIMATPFLKNLRVFFPKAKITMLVGKWSSQVLANNPYIDGVIEFDESIIMKKKMLKVLSLSNKLRKEKFDTCFILDKSWMWGLFALLSKIKTRIGFSRGKEGRFNTLSAPYNGTKNEVDCNLDLLSLIGLNPQLLQPIIFSKKSDILLAKKIFAQLSKSQLSKKSKSSLKLAIGIAPGGAANPGQKALIKRWPYEHYLKLTDSIDAQFIIFGGYDDSNLAKQIIKNSKNKRIYNATNLSIQQAKELMEHCDIIVAHDSGSLHIASATFPKTKIIALFGPTPSARFCPKRAFVIHSNYPVCYDAKGQFKNCNQNIMSSISPEKVAAKIGKVIKSNQK